MTISRPLEVAIRALEAVLGPCESVPKMATKATGSSSGRKYESFDEPSFYFFNDYGFERNYSVPARAAMSERLNNKFVI